MEYAKHLYALAAQLYGLAETCENDAVYDELIVAANVLSQAAETIDLHTKAFVA
jgi:hypothetical protein